MRPAQGDTTEHTERRHNDVTANYTRVTGQVRRLRDDYGKDWNKTIQDTEEWDALADAATESAA